MTKPSARRAVLIGLLLVAGMSLSQSSLAQVSTGLNTGLTIEHAGATRSYDLYVPEGLDGPAPLVLELHALDETPRGQRGFSNSTAVAEREKFLIAYPAAIGNRWNEGVLIRNASDDVGFVLALVAAIDALVAIDASRVYATGFSNGGLMTQRLACETSGTFAAYVALAATVLPNSDPETRCPNHVATSILTVRGQTDDFIPFNGGTAFQGTTVASAQEAFEFWRDFSDCDAGSLQTSSIADGDCQTYTSCAADTQVKFCAVTGTEQTGHIIYRNRGDVDLAQFGWDFVKDFQLSVANGFQINAGLSGAWFEPATSGQGVLLDVVPSTGTLFMAWFTFDPDLVSTENAPAHQWLTAQGPYLGAAAVDMTLLETSGGMFDAPASVANAEVGTASLEFISCTEATLSYDLPAQSLSGEIALARITPDVFCTDAAVRSARLRR